jgi:hypothetical protein
MKVQDFTGVAGLRLLKRHHLLFATVAPPAWQDRFRDYDPTAFTIVRCSAAVPPPAAVDVKTAVGGVDNRGDSWSFDWHHPETAAGQLELWWDGDKVRAIRLTMADGQQTPTWGDGGYNHESITFDPGDVPTGRPPSTIKSIRTGYAGYRGGALGAVAVDTDDGRHLTTGPVAANQELDHDRVVGQVITGIYGKCSSGDGWNYMASLGFYVRPPKATTTPFQSVPGVMPVRRLTFYSDAEKIRAVSVEVDGVPSTYGDPRAATNPSYRSDALDLGADEQVARIVVRTRDPDDDEAPAVHRRAGRPTGGLGGRAGRGRACRRPARHLRDGGPVRRRPLLHRAGFRRPGAADTAAAVARAPAGQRAVLQPGTVERGRPAGPRRCAGQLQLRATPAARSGTDARLPHGAGGRRPAGRRRNVRRQVARAGEHRGDVG